MKGRPKKVKEEELTGEAFSGFAVVEQDFSTEVPVVAKKAHIAHVSIDMGREDLNNLGKKINEIIDRLNEKN